MTSVNTLKEYPYMAPAAYSVKLNPNEKLFPCTASHSGSQIFDFVKLKELVVDPDKLNFRRDVQSKHTQASGSSLYEVSKNFAARLGGSCPAMKGLAMMNVEAEFEHKHSNKNLTMFSQMRLMEIRGRFAT